MPRQPRRGQPRYDVGRDGAVREARRIKILYADPTATVAAYDEYLLDALLSRSEIEVRAWIGRAKHAPEMLRSFEALATPGVALPPAGTTRWARMRKFARHLLNWVHTLRAADRGLFDGVHVQWLPVLEPIAVDLWFLRALKRLGVPIAYTVHNVLPHTPSSRSRWIYRRVYAEVNRLIVHTEAAKRRLIEEFDAEEQKVQVIPHGPLSRPDQLIGLAEARRQLGLPTAATIFLLFGHLAPYKGVDIALRAFSQLLERQPGAVHLIVAGRISDEYRDELEALVQERGVPSSSLTQDYGWVSDQLAVAYYSAADVVLFPYRAITQSGALLECIGYGKPYLASKLPAFVETSGRVGGRLLVNDLAPAHWRDAMVRALDAPEELRSAARKVRNRVMAEAGWDLIAAETVRVYREMVGAR